MFNSFFAQFGSRKVNIKTIIKITSLGISLSLIITASFLAYVAVPFFGNKALIVRSGSMTPAISVGDLVVVHTSGQIVTPTPGTLPKYKIGDVVAFSGQKDPKTIITHRITGVKTEEGKILYETKGDANNAPDGNFVAENKILGKNTFKIPGLGKIFALAKTRSGFLALVVVPALLVILFETYSIVREIIKIRRKDSQPATQSPNIWTDNPNKILLKVLLPFVICTMFFQGSFSSYADVENANGNFLEAAASFDPQNSPGPSPSASPSPSPSSIPLAAHVVISEIQINGNSASEDFVELYNPTASSVGLSGWQLRVRNSSGTESSLVLIGSGKIIPAHGFFLWARSDNNFATTLGADVSTTVGLSANNSIRLEDAGDIAIDQVGWGSGTSQFVEGTLFPTNPTAGESIERKANTTSTEVSMNIGGADEFKGNGADSDNNSTNLLLRLISEPQKSTSPAETP